MSKEKKPFKETAFGKLLTEKAPKVLDVIGDVLPDKGLLGIVKNIIDKDDSIPAEVKMELQKSLQDFEKEMFALEIQDKDSARHREIEVIKSLGHADRMQIFVGGVMVLAFFATLILIGFKEIPERNEHIMINALGILEGAVLAVITYYYGSSMGSRIKDMKR